MLLLPALTPGSGILGEVECEHLTDEAVCVGPVGVVGADADESVGVCVELILEGDNDDIHAAPGAVTDVGGDLEERRKKMRLR